MTKPRTDIEAQEHWKKWASAIGGLVSIGLAALGFMTPFDSHNPVKITQAFVLGFWLIAPPVWFWYEYHLLWKKGNWAPQELDGFKYGQDQASKIWLALVTLLLVIYFGQGLMRENPPPCTSQQTSTSTTKP
jgi:hypothetical protein